jgi:hypothetical protein
VATAGDHQSATVGTAFTTPLSVTVEDADGNPVLVAGISVTFTAPGTGASGTFVPTHAVTTTATTDTRGVASATVFVANTTVGAYTVVASSTGLTSADFSETNSSNPCAAYTGNKAFVCWVYEDLLYRAPESAGLTYWNYLLLSGLSRGAFAAAILASTEYRRDLVNDYYETFLGRAGDSGGLAYWVAQLNARASDQSVLAAILGSGQFYANSGSTPVGFVTALYTKLLGRAPDSGGLAFWTNQLSSGAIRGALAGAILGSSEYRSAFVEAQYVHLLRRASDSGGLAFWMAQLARGASNESIIVAIVGSSQFYTEATS